MTKVPFAIRPLVGERIPADLMTGLMTVVLPLSLLHPVPELTLSISSKILSIRYAQPGTAFSDSAPGSGASFYFAKLGTARDLLCS
jgi:hypothetical protein